MSDSYQKYIKLLPSQTADFIEGVNSQDNVIFDNINYYANLFESDILIDTMTITGNFPNAGKETLLILSKLGPWQKIQHKEQGQIIFEQVYQQEKCRMDSDIFWDCQDVAGGNLFFSRVRNQKFLAADGNNPFVPSKGIQGQVLDATDTAALLGSNTLLKEGQMSNYFPFVNLTGANATTFVFNNIRIPLKYFFYNTLYQTKQFNGYLPLKNSELLFQFSQFDNYLKRAATTEGISANIAALVSSPTGVQLVTSVRYSGISLMLNTLNYIPLEKPVQFSYYNTLIEKQTIQTKINDLDIVSDKSLLQVFFQYYPITQTQLAYLNPGWQDTAGAAQIVIDELHYSNDKILPRLEGNSAELKLFVKNQLRVINPKLDIDQFFKTTNVVPLVLDNFSLIGETNPAKIRIRYATANTDYQLLMMQVTSRIIQISQNGLELLI